MDIEQQSKMQCKRHPQCDVLYIQINDISDEQDIFQCDLCILQTSNFNVRNYVSISSILESNEGTILNNYPPLGNFDNKIGQEIYEIRYQNQKPLQINQIKDYFDNLKNQVYKMIEEHQNRMIESALEAIKINEVILTNYQNISQLNVLKSIIQDNTKNQDEKEQQCQDFVKSMYIQKDQNTQLFQSLLQSKNKLESQIQLEKIDYLQVKLLELLDQFNLLSLNLENKLETEEIDLLPRVKFTKYLYEQEYSQNLQLIKNPVNNEINFVSKESNQWGSYYTNMILNRDRQYRFRLKAKQLNQSKTNYLVFGLVRDEKKDINYCTRDYMSCSLCYNNNNTFSLSQYAKGLSQIVKGTFNQIPQETELELFVSIRDGILEVTDFPNRNHKIILRNENKVDMISYKNLRFFIGMENKINITLLAATEI